MTANFRAEPHTGAVKVKGTSEVVASRESFGSLNSDKCSRLGAVELLVTMAMWALNVAGGIFSIVSIFLTKSCVVKVALFRTSVLSPPAERAHTAPVTCGSLVRLFFLPWGNVRREVAVPLCTGIIVNIIIARYYVCIILQWFLWLLVCLRGWVCFCVCK